MLRFLEMPSLEICHHITTRGFLAMLVVYGHVKMRSIAKIYGNAVALTYK
ncbi:hypothetical protein QVL63_07560 [Bartonella henselae]|nr:hypothetical protein [Bartonella henselae]MDM9995948.1 hypothetical protein [Bartonella henselae]